MATDDGAVLPAGENGLNKAEPAQAARQGFELMLADAPRVGRIGAQAIDRDIIDREGGKRLCASGAWKSAGAWVQRKGCARNARRGAWARRDGEGGEVVGDETPGTRCPTVGAARADFG